MNWKYWRFRIAKALGAYEMASYVVSSPYHCEGWAQALIIKLTWEEFLATLTRNQKRVLFKFIDKKRLTKQEKEVMMIVIEKFRKVIMED